MHIPLHNRPCNVLTGKTVLKGSKLIQTLTLIVTLRGSLLLYTFPLSKRQLSISKPFKTKALWRNTEFLSIFLFVYYLSAYLLGLRKYFNLFSTNSYSSHPFNFQLPVEAVWKISSRMVQVSDRYEQLEAEVQKETPKNPERKLSTALQAILMPSASLNYLSL